MTKVLKLLKITFSLRTLIDIYPFKIHFSDGYRGVNWIFYVTKLGVTGINVDNWYHCRHFPGVGATTVEIGPCKFNWSLISTIYYPAIHPSILTSRGNPAGYERSNFNVEITHFIPPFVILWQITDRSSELNKKALQHCTFVLMRSFLPVRSVWFLHAV